MRFLLRVCQFFFFFGSLSLFLVTANEIFSLGIWPNGYPGPGATDSNGRQLAVSYGEFMLRTGIIVVVAGVLGMFLMIRLQRRHTEMILLAEEIQAIEEAESGSDGWEERLEKEADES